MNLLRYSRLSVRLVSVVALGFALWLLLVPRIALYFVNDEGTPFDIDVKYAWGRGTSDQVFILPSQLLAEEGVTVETADRDGLVTSVRLNCGTVFTSGDREQDSPGGEAACSEIETPRWIGGAGLGVLGIVGLVVARRLPSTRNVTGRT